MEAKSNFTAFAGHKRIAKGDRAQVATAVKTLLDAEDPRPVLVFADPTGEQVDFDLQGSLEDIVARYTPEAPVETRRKPGRPKLGVVGKEITLLPRHWEWLSTQPGGPSVMLRKLVELAIKGDLDAARVRRAREAVYRFITAIAGNEPGYEDACRALFAGDRDAYDEHTRGWPRDVREYVGRLATEAFPNA